LYDVFLRVGITKYYKLHQNMLTDRVDGTPNPARALTNTVRPPIAKAIWGMIQEYILHTYAWNMEKVHPVHRSA